ncbi:IS66 family insertion sequence element accessory protein TnpB [Rhodovulum sulfidophilum]|nr:IS66 family insertion sequence element accessory protein TnpB [Rhodovulum sulfidophilum]
MIAPSSSYRIYLATHPVDFRKGMDGLANYVMTNFELDPFSGAFFVFRSKGRDKIKVLMWDGTGLVLIYKRIEGAGLAPPSREEQIRLVCSTRQVQKSRPVARAPGNRRSSSHGGSASPSSRPRGSICAASRR